MINNEKELKFYYNESEDVSFVKYRDLGYKIGNDIEKYTKDEIDSLLIASSLIKNNCIYNNCKFEHLILFINQYISNSNLKISNQQLIDNFHMRIFNKFFFLRRPSCFSQITKLVRIRKVAEMEYDYHFKHENERCVMSIKF